MTRQKSRAAAWAPARDRSGPAAIGLTMRDRFAVEPAGLLAAQPPRGARKICVRRSPYLRRQSAFKSRAGWDFLRRYLGCRQVR
jgi:hypothetical protein